jgi:hypothetical protein
MTTKWDYLTVLADINPIIFDPNGKRGLDAKLVNDMLCLYGSQGWELVSTQNINTDGATTQVLFMFKKLGTEQSTGDFKRIGFDLDGDGLPG